MDYNMATVISCVNLKGGVGKTALAVNFAAYCGKTELSQTFSGFGMAGTLRVITRRQKTLF